MSDTNLKAFLAENAIKADAVEYVASARFRGSDGEAIAWKLSPITNEENRSIAARCKHKTTVPGTRETRVELDQELYAAELTAACVTFPNLNDGGLQASYSAVGAVDLLGKMLTPGEFTDLFQAVLQANNFDSGMSDKIKTAKN